MLHDGGHLKHANTSIFSILLQVLHADGNHWLAVSNIGFQPGHEGMYNSLPSGTISRRTKQQIATIVCTENAELVIDHQELQLQRGSSDCGLFAPAFTTSLCAGEDPTKISYVQHALRPAFLPGRKQDDTVPPPFEAMKEAESSPAARHCPSVLCLLTS